MGQAHSHRQHGNHELRHLFTFSRVSMLCCRVSGRCAAIMPMSASAALVRPKCASADSPSSACPAAMLHSACRRAASAVSAQAWKDSWRIWQHAECCRLCDHDAYLCDHDVRVRKCAAKQHCIAKQHHVSNGLPAHLESAVAQQALVHERLHHVLQRPQLPCSAGVVAIRATPITVCWTQTARRCVMLLRTGRRAVSLQAYPGWSPAPSRRGCAPPAPHCSCPGTALRRRPQRHP